VQHGRKKIISPACKSFWALDFSALSARNQKKEGSMVVVTVNGCEISQTEVDRAVEKLLVEYEN
jgi:hypothetical protein